MVIVIVPTTRLVAAVFTILAEEVMGFEVKTEVDKKLIVLNKGSKLILKVEEVPDHQLVREGEKKAAEVKFSSHLKLDTLFIKNNKKDEEK